MIIRLSILITAAIAATPASAHVAPEGKAGGNRAGAGLMIPCCSS